jgi:TRAP-type C4-dicarboxylate transport system permease small subunit
MTEKNQANLFAKLDRFIFSIEALIVSICAVVMTVSVCLDILYRSLKSVQTEPSLSILSVFGLFKNDYQSDRAALLPILIAIIGIFGLGYAIKAAMTRQSALAQDQGNQHQHHFLENSKWGLISLIGFYALSLFVLHTPSYLVCSILWVLILGAITIKDFQDQRIPQAVVKAIFLVVGLWITWKIPQDYIWSQELSLILLSWVAFLGASMSTFEKKHIQLGALAGALPKSIQPYSYALGLLVTALFCAYVDYLVFKGIFGANGSFFNGEQRPATQIPAYFILLSAGFAFMLMTLRFFYYGIEAIINPQMPEEVIH